MPSRATWASGSCSCWSCRPATSCCPPSAYAVRRSGELFEREFGTEHGNSDPTYLTHEARRQLRPKFLGADIAMTGVNFAVASTGTLAVCTNEGNADMGTSFPDLHIAIMGLEKVIPDMRALAVFTRLLARSGTGQPSPPTRRSTASLHRANGYTS